MAVLTEKLEIKIDGKIWKDYDFSDLILIQEIQKPNELRFCMKKNILQENEEDINFSLSSKLLGKKVELVLTTIRRNEKEEFQNDTLEFSGLIFNVNSLRSTMGTNLITEVIAYSPDYLLFDSPHCFSYENQNLATIISDVTGSYDVNLINQPAYTEDIPYTVQYNETNYKFINRLAQRFGEWFYYNGKELVFGKIKKFDSLELYPDTDILSYQYRLDVEHMNFTHAQHNYLDYTNPSNSAKTFANGKIKHNMTDIVSSESESMYKKETFQNLHCSNPEVNSSDETEISAKTQSLGKKAQMMFCKANTNRADLKIGSVIKIKEIFKNPDNTDGFCYHDELIICKVIHAADINGNYENEILAISATSEYPPYSFNDLYPQISTQRAVVKDNKDPEKLGRIRVQFLWQKEQDDSLMTPWIRIAQPHGGANKGFYFVPEIDEEVMVGFENGNAEKPYVTGTLYQGQQRPGENWYNDDNNIKAIRTRNGHTVEIYDEGDGGYIKIYDNEKDNYILTFSTDEKLIKLQSTGNIELYAENDIIMEAGNNISAKAGKNISSEAGDNFNVDAGKNITESAGDNVSIDAGKNMNLNAQDNISESAGKNLTISAEKDGIISISKNMTLSVGKDLDADISKNLYTKVADKFDLKAKDIEQASDKQLKLIANKLEQKADSSMTINGGSKMDIKASNVKIN